MVGVLPSRQDCEEQQRLKAEEVVTSRDNAKLLNDDDNLEVSRKL